MRFLNDYFLHGEEVPLINTFQGAREREKDKRSGIAHRQNPRF